MCIAPTPCSVIKHPTANWTGVSVSQLQIHPVMFCGQTLISTIWIYMKYLQCTESAYRFRSGLSVLRCNRTVVFRPASTGKGPLLLRLKMSRPHRRSDQDYHLVGVQFIGFSLVPALLDKVWRQRTQNIQSFETQVFCEKKHVSPNQLLQGSFHPCSPTVLPQIATTKSLVQLLGFPEQTRDQNSSKLARLANVST